MLKQQAELQISKKQKISLTRVLSVNIGWLIQFQNNLCSVLSLQSDTPKRDFLSPKAADLHGIEGSKPTKTLFYCLRLKIVAASVIF